MTQRKNKLPAKNPHNRRSYEPPKEKRPINIFSFTEVKIKIRMYTLLLTH